MSSYRVTPAEGARSQGFTQKKAGTLARAVLRWAHMSQLEAIWAE